MSFPIHPFLTSANSTLYKTHSDCTSLLPWPHLILAFDEMNMSAVDPKGRQPSFRRFETLTGSPQVWKHVQVQDGDGRTLATCFVCRDNKLSHLGDGQRRYEATAIYAEAVQSS